MMMVTVVLLDKELKEVKNLEVDVEKIAEASIVTHEGKHYGYHRMPGLMKVEFMSATLL